VGKSAAALDVGFGVDLGIDQRAGAAQVHIAQHVGPEDLEAATAARLVELILSPGLSTALPHCRLGATA